MEKERRSGRDKRVKQDRRKSNDPEFEESERRSGDERRTRRDRRKLKHSEF
jgi:hypothetical protein